MHVTHDRSSHIRVNNNKDTTILYIEIATIRLKVRKVKEKQYNRQERKKESCDWYNLV